MEQAQLQLTFELTDALRDGRLRDLQVLSRPVHPLVLDNGKEVLELSDIHSVNLPSTHGGPA
ncbi:hypothetical protein GCM10023094_08360 [Rhodococcus olei]|uniref:Uncharacterized protein n=1 Tax=Rhodococcus olei TaxID=2161675 RepID=A0ABP8NVJ1_9NOCA